MKKILITGAGGQLGWELARLLADKADIETVLLTSAELDITRADSVQQMLKKHQPSAVINCAAYTAVDKAEEEIDRASQVNAAGAQNIADACKEHGAYLLQVSTDFVFNGDTGSPYLPDSPRNPLSVYGKTKAQGELAVEGTLEANWAIIRTAWVYSSHGNNFVKTMLRLMQEKPALSIVGDQIGTPTWAKSLAQACYMAVEQKLQGVYHYTDAGVASWYDFAVAIQHLGLEKGLLKKAIPIKPIRTEDYPLPAPRPAYSVLDKSSTYEALPALPVVHWRDQLNGMLEELAP